MTKYQIRIIGESFINKIESDDWVIEDGCHIFYDEEGDAIAAFPVNMSIVTIEPHVDLRS
jgi:hypothetical protein